MTGKGRKVATVLSEAQHSTTPKKRELSVNQKCFLAAYAECGTPTYAAIAAQIDRSRHYHWLKNETYAEAFEAAQSAACEALENEARRRAIEGVLDDVWYQGKPVGKQRRFSDVLLIFLLKGAMPERYRDRVQVTAEVAVPVPDPGREALSDADLAKLIETAKQLRE